MQQESPYKAESTEKNDSSESTTESPVFELAAETTSEVQNFGWIENKYQEERNRRLRADAHAQYVELKGSLARLGDDPHGNPSLKRESVTDSVDAVVIGGGFGGLLAAVRLYEAGIRSIRIIEKGADFGGTWYWNRYPGAACDIESYVYMPLLEEVGTIPSEKYAKAPEIFAHTQAIGRHFKLYPLTLFQTEATSLQWDNDNNFWAVRTDRGDRLQAKFVVLSTGPLNKPKLPGIPGLETFQGHTFHTSRWDYAYTKGDSKGGMTGLAGKRVGIIGTGATAVQCAPHVAHSAERLYVFQRTPSSIDARNNRATDEAWASVLRPGWQQHRMDNFNNIVCGIPEAEDLVSDGWTDAMRLTRPDPTSVDPLNSMKLADHAKMGQIRARVDRVVRDPKTADALKPWYKLFCKRPCFHDEYLDMFNRPNVTLVDTAGKGVERIVSTGAVVNGQEYPLDCIIFATGFEVGTGFERRSGFELLGRGGLALSEKWSGGASTLHGLLTRGFPNCFIMGITQSGQSPNFTHMINEQARHIAYIAARCRDGGWGTVEPTTAAETQWTQTIVAAAGARAAYQADCTPGYYNGEGKLTAIQLRNAPYGKGSAAFIDLLRVWRAQGDYAGLEFNHNTAGVQA